MIPQTNPLSTGTHLLAEIESSVHWECKSGRYILGEETARFEREFARYIGCEFAVGVANGTEAICLALQACGVKPGDKVITVSHTAVATVAAIDMCGAVPLLAEIDPKSYTMNPASLAAVMTRDIRAIVPVHLYG